MSSQVESVDQYGEADPNTNRYSWALRRSARVVAAVALVVGLLAAVLLGGSTESVERRFVIQPGAEVLALAGLDEAFANLVPLVDVSEFINGIATADDSLDAQAINDLTAPGVIVLTVTADTSELATSESDELLAAVNEWIGGRKAVAVEPVRDVLASQLVLAEERLVVLDSEISALVASDALRDSYLAERSDLNTSIRNLNRSEVALTLYSSETDHYEIVGTDAITGNTRILWFIVGAFLGMMLAVVAVLIRAHGDRRVRTRTELRAITNAPILAVLPSGGDQFEPAVSALRAAAARLGSDGSLSFVPVDDQVTAAFAADGDGSLPGLHIYSPRSKQAPPPPGSSMVVAAAWGRTHGDDVVLTCQYLDGLGFNVAGCVLTDVPPSQLRRSMS